MEGNPSHSPFDIFLFSHPVFGGTTAVVRDDHCPVRVHEQCVGWLRVDIPPWSSIIQSATKTQATLHNQTKATGAPARQRRRQRYPSTNHVVCIPHLADNAPCTDAVAGSSLSPSRQRALRVAASSRQRPVS